MKHSQPTLVQSLLILAIATLVLLGCIVKANISTGISLLYAASICALIAVGLGRRWEEMFDNILEMVGKALPSMFILLLAGLINASWIASGTIPLLIAYGLKLLSPRLFLLIAFVLCLLISMVTGSSWATVSSFGLALIGIANGQTIPLALAAGAIVSGCFLGGKWSPLSDSVNLAAAITEQNANSIFRQMIPSTAPTIVCCGILYALLGFTMVNSSGSDGTEIQALISAIEGNFNLNIMLLLPVAVVLVLGVKGFSIIPVLLAGVFVALLEAFFFQQMGFVEISEILWSGYVAHTGHPVMDALLTRGGLLSMTDLLILLFCAFTFAGILEKTGALEGIINRLLSSIKKPIMLVLSAILTTIATVCLSSSEYVAMILNARMYLPVYKKFNLNTVGLAHIITEVAVYMGALVPWSAGALLSSKTLGVSTVQYMPYVFAAWINILFTCLVSYKRMGKS